MTAPNPALVAERDRRLAELGPLPSWWRFFARRRWRRERATILAVDVSEMAALLRRLYPIGIIEQMTTRCPPFSFDSARGMRPYPGFNATFPIDGGVPRDPGDEARLARSRAAMAATSNAKRTDDVHHDPGDEDRGR